MENCNSVSCVLFDSMQKGIDLVFKKTQVLQYSGNDSVQQYWYSRQQVSQWIGYIVKVIVVK